MPKYTVAVILEFNADDDDGAKTFVDEICNETTADFVWLDTLVSEDEKSFLPRLGPPEE